MASTNDEHDAINQSIGTGFNKQDNGTDTTSPKSKPTTRRTSKPGTKHNRTTASPTSPTSPTRKTIEKTEVILNEVKSDLPSNDDDIRLKSADIDSLPDEGILLGGATSMLLMLLDGVGMMAWGDFARLNTTEKAMIEEPLKRMLAKVSSSQLASISKYTDPILLSMGLLSWITRVTNENKKRKDVIPQDQSEPKAKTVEPVVTASNVDEVNTFPPNEIVDNFEAMGKIL